MYSKFRTNVRALRKSWGESQDSLAVAIGFESGTVISRYENGKRTPDRDIISKIAKHYRITEDELLNGDFSGCKSVGKNIINDKETTRRRLEVYIPIVVSEESLRNRDFKEASCIHNELYDEISEGRIFNIAKFERCCELYERAEKDGVIEAVANQIAWVMYLGMAFTLATPEMIYAPSLFKEKGLTVKQAVKCGLLPSFRKDETEDEEINEWRKISEDFFNGSDVELLANIRKLKETNLYADLANYYLALRYQFGFVKNDLTPEMNWKVGEEMLFSLGLIGNPYADKYFVSTKSK